MKPAVERTSEDLSDWAISAVREGAAERAARAKPLEQARAAEAQTRLLVAQEGEQWLERFVACVREGADAVNRHTGRAGLRISGHGLGGVAVAQVNGSALATAAPDLRHGPHDSPGILWTNQLSQGGARSTPFDFVSDGGTLLLLVAGEELSAEDAARRLLGPWLRRLSL